MSAVPRPHGTSRPHGITRGSSTVAAPWPRHRLVDGPLSRRLTLPSRTGRRRSTVSIPRNGTEELPEDDPAPALAATKTAGA